eukprot:scpid106944/ scgid15079/ 
MIIEHPFTGYFTLNFTSSGGCVASGVFSMLSTKSIGRRQICTAWDMFPALCLVAVGCCLSTYLSLKGHLHFPELLDLAKWTELCNSFLRCLVCLQQANSGVVPH